MRKTNQNTRSIGATWYGHSLSWGLTLLASAAVLGCRTFNYSTTDMDRERRQMTEGEVFFPTQIWNHHGPGRFPVLKGKSVGNSPTRP